MMKAAVGFLLFESYSLQRPALRALQSTSWPPKRTTKGEILEASLRFLLSNKNCEGERNEMNETTRRCEGNNLCLQKGVDKLNFELLPR